jgi:hypothetical protein
LMGHYYYYFLLVGTKRKWKMKGKKSKFIEKILVNIILGCNCLFVNLFPLLDCEVREPGA